MIRKFVLAAAAIAALGTVSLTASTTPAAAWGKGGGVASASTRVSGSMTPACAPVGS
jgi:hypothetical protein